MFSFFLDRSLEMELLASVLIVLNFQEAAGMFPRVCKVRTVSTFRMKLLTSLCLWAVPDRGCRRHAH